MTQISEEINYKEAYEKEHLKSAQLASRVAELEEKNDLLEFKLNRIKTNPLWVHTTGLRKVMHAVLRQTTRAPTPKSSFIRSLPFARNSSIMSCTTESPRTIVALRAASNI